MKWGFTLLNTILGDIEISINGQIVIYNVIELPNKGGNFNVDNRYEITVDKIDDYKSDVNVDCKLNCSEYNCKSGSESGENLEMISFWCDNKKLSIGSEGELQGVKYKYLENGINIVIEKTAPISSLKFYVAWITMSNRDVEDIYTWFGADPTL